MREQGSLGYMKEDIGEGSEVFLPSLQILSHTRLTVFFQVNRILKWRINSLISSCLILKFCEMGSI